MIDESKRDGTRREFLAAGAAFVMSAQGPARPPLPVDLPTMKAKTEMRSGPLPTPISPNRRLGFAIVGLGELALGEVLPAFGRCKFARPTALVSGNRAKAEKVAD